MTTSEYQDVIEFLTVKFQRIDERIDERFDTLKRRMGSPEAGVGALEGRVEAWRAA